MYIYTSNMFTLFTEKYVHNIIASTCMYLLEHFNTFECSEGRKKREIEIHKEKREGQGGERERDRDRLTFMRCIYIVCMFNC